MNQPDKEPQPINSCDVFRPKWKRRIAVRLFPHKIVHWPQMAAAKDGIYVRVVVDVSIIDRIKLLFSGRLATVSKTRTQYAIGDTKTDSAAYVAAPEWMER